MSSYYQPFNAHQQHNTHSNAQNGSVHRGSRRNNRGGIPPNVANKQYQKIVKREEEAALVISYRRQFECARSFDLEDDAEFCPNLLTEEDMVSINGSGSDRSSLASGSPTNSPQSTQVSVNLSPDTSFSLTPNSHPFVQSGFNVSALKIHQPSATRIGRNAIPIVNPNDGGLMPSPPSSVSPARMQQHQTARPIRFY